VFFDVPPVVGAAAVGLVGVANAKWAAGAPPTVGVTHSTLGSVTVRLRDTSTQDPNVRSGDTVIFLSGDDGNYHALDSQLDSKIGTVKFWLGTAGNIPAGWRRLNAGGTYNADDRFIKAIDAGYTNMGFTGGAASHTHTGTTNSDGSHDHGGVTGSGGSHDHGGATATGGSHDHGGSTGSASPGTDSQLSSGNTDYATTGITIGNNTTGITIDAHGTGAGPTLGYGADYTPINSINDHTLTDPAHNHTVTEPNSGTGHFHALSGLSHSHTVNSHTHTISSQAAHDHAIASSGTHTHTITSGGAHTHTVTTGSTANDPQYLVLAIIERYE
jgi:hypothetical protein